MEEENKLSEPPVYSKKRKFALELKDVLAGVAFPFMLTLILSATIIEFARVYNPETGEGLSLSLVALIGGELLYAVALIIFGRANGAAAYKKTVANMQKRELGSTDETVLYRTGEYALWKGFLIGFILCVPFIIIQIIELCVDNVFCNFCLEYLCGWAYFPFHYLGKNYQALNFIMIAFPVAIHALGYYLGKLKQIEVQRKLEETNASRKGRKK